MGKWDAFPIADIGQTKAPVEHDWSMFPVSGLESAPATQKYNIDTPASRSEIPNYEPELDNPVFTENFQAQARQQLTEQDTQPFDPATYFAKQQAEKQALIMNAKESGVIPIRPEAQKYTPEDVKDSARLTPIPLTTSIAYGAEKGGEILFSKLDNMATVIANATGLEKGGLFKNLKEGFADRAEYWQQVLDEKDTGKIDELIGTTIGGFPAAIAEWQTGSLTAGVSGYADTRAEGKGQLRSIAGGIEAGVKRFLLGQALEYIGHIKNPIVRRGTGATVMAGTTAIEGGSPPEIAIQGLMGGYLSGYKPKIKEVKPPLPRQEQATDYAALSEKASTRLAQLEQAAKTTGITSQEKYELDFIRNNLMKPENLYTTYGRPEAPLMSEADMLAIPNSKKGTINLNKEALFPERYAKAPIVTTDAPITPPITTATTTTKPVEAIKPEVSTNVPPEAESGKNLLLTPTESKGKLSPSKLSEKIKADAEYVFKNLNSPEELAHQLSLPNGETNVLNMKKQALDAASLDRESKLDIIEGRKKPPAHITPEAVFLALEKEAWRNNDHETIQRLARSPLIGEASELGKRMRTLAERNEYSPTKIVAEVEKIRMATSTNKGTPEKVLKKVLARAEKNELKVQKELVLQHLDTAISETTTKTRNNTKPLDAKSPEYGSKNKVVKKDAYEAALTRLRQQGVISAGIDPARFVDMVEIAAYHLEATARNIPEWSRQVKSVFGDMSRPELDKLRKSAEAKLFADDKNDVIAKMQKRQEQDKPLLDNPQIIYKLEDMLIGQGFNTNKKLLNEMTKIIQEISPGTSRVEVLDAITGAHRQKALDNDPIKVRRREINAELQQKKKLIDIIVNKQVPTLFGGKRQPMSDEARALAKKAQERKKISGLETTDPEKQVQSAIDTIEKRLSNRIKDLNRQIQTGKRDIHEKKIQPSNENIKKMQAEVDTLQKRYDEIFKKKPLTQEQRIKLATYAVERSIADIENQIKTGELPDTKQKPTSPELEALRSKRDELSAQRDLIIARKYPNRKNEIALRSYMHSLASEKAKIDDMIAKGQFAKPEKTSVVSSVLEGKYGIKPKRDLQTLQFARDKAKRDVQLANDVIAKKGGITQEEIKTIVNLSQRVEEMQNVVADNPTKENRIKYGESMLDISDFKQAIAPKQRTGGDIALDVLGIPQALMTTIDVSFPFRQGWGSMATKEYWSAFKNMYGYMFSESKLRKLTALMKGSPERLAIAKRSKLGLTDLGKDIALHEEGMQTTYAEQIPVAGHFIKGSQRAYTGFANHLRWYRFNNMLDAAELANPNLKWNSKEGIKVSRDIAKVVNDFSGRGAIGFDDRGANWTPALNQVIFSTRNLSANVNLMLDPVNYITLSPIARKMAQKQLLGSLAITAGIATMAASAGWKFVYDDTSADFGKLVRGNQRMEILGGKSRLPLMLARMVREKTTSSVTGKANQLNTGKFGETTKLDIAEREVRNKLAPGMSWFVDTILAESTALGAPVKTPKQIAKRTLQMFYPMSIADSVSIFKNETYSDKYVNMLSNIITAVAVLHGDSSQVYANNVKGLSPEIADTLGKYNVMIGNDPLEFGENKAQDPVTGEVLGITIKPTDKMYDRYHEILPKEINSIMAFIKENKDWDGYDDATKRKYLNLYVKNAKSMAKKQVFVENMDKGQ